MQDTVTPYTAVIIVKVTVINCTTWKSNLKMEAEISFETLVTIPKLHGVTIII